MSFAVSVAFVSHAALASPITYTFTQYGFVDANGDTGYIAGTFVATPESYLQASLSGTAPGTILTSDVSKFAAHFMETLNGAGGSGKMTGVTFGGLDDFFYDPSNPNSLEFSSGYAASGVVLCSGLTDVETVCQPNDGGKATYGFFEDLPGGLAVSTTSQPAAVTALPPPSVAPDSPAPEPGTLTMFATGLGLLLTGCLRKSLWSTRAAHANPPAN